MNTLLQNYARKNLMEGLSKCTQRQQHIFKRLYANENLEMSIDEIVEKMGPEKLDWAMQQVQNTLDKM